MIIAAILDMLVALTVISIWLFAIAVGGFIIAAIVFLIGIVVEWAWDRIVGAL